jgi:hypothetical protein
MEALSFPAPVKIMKAKAIICPNCQCLYRGEPRKEPRGSVLIGLLLCLFFLAPGLLYFGLTEGYRYYCPQCGLQLGESRQ